MFGVPISKTTLAIIFTIVLFNKTCLSQDYYEEIEYPDSINIISMLPLNFDTIFIGGSTQYATGGVYRSFDSGITWEYVGLNGLSIYCMSHGNGDTIYAGTIGVYRSNNLGESWERISPIEQNVISISGFFPDDIFIGYWGGIMRSLDNGNTWDTSLVLSQNTVINTILPVGENEIYAGGTAYTAQDAGVFKSADLGEIWNYIGLVGYNIQSLGFNSNQDLFAGCFYSGLLKTSNGGLTWETVLPNRDAVSLVIEFDEIYVGCENQSFPNGGIYYSPDNGLTWENRTYNITNNRIKDIVITPDQFLYSLSRYESTVLGPALNRSVNPVFINESNQDKNVLVQIFPNPASDFFQISINQKFLLEENIKIFIYNQKGQMLESDSLVLLPDYFCHTINITELTSGIYYVKLVIGKNKYLLKLVVI
ncbi:MAG: T9SS type A sorting domain-containing protein [Bacteroidales bacterium]|jgi:hypothetical protein|nr:T9SS type A sorting domain-containing protein [Bacteroidales bacterium]